MAEAKKKSHHHGIQKVSGGTVYSQKVGFISEGSLHIIYHDL